jgi:ribosome-associated heat shock protein Hsp15
MASADPAAHAAREPAERVRLDKWLWAARFYKTRTLAALAIENGQARLNDARVKPAHGVRIGDSVSVRKGGLAWEVRVAALSDRRGPATIAATLYLETPESAARRTEEALRRKVAAEGRAAGRPTKRERRKLEDFLNEP